MQSLMCWHEAMIRLFNLMSERHEFCALSEGDYQRFSYLLQLQQAWQHIHALRNRVHNHFRRHAMARANEQDEKHIGCHVAVSEDPGKKQHGSLRTETGPLAQARHAMG